MHDLALLRRVLESAESVLTDDYVTTLLHQLDVIEEAHELLARDFSRLQVQLAERERGEQLRLVPDIPTECLGLGR